MTSLRLSATSPGADEREVNEQTLRLEEKKTPRLNDENRPLGANTDRHKALGSCKAIPVSSPLVRSTSTDLARRAAAAVATAGTPLPPPPQRAVSFGRVNSFGSQASFTMVASPARAVRQSSFALSRDGSFHLGPAVGPPQTQPKHTPRGPSLTPRGTRPAPQMHRSLSRGPPIEAKMTRSLSRDSRGVAQPHHTADACRAGLARRTASNFGDGVQAARSRAREPLDDDGMPVPAMEVVEPHASGRIDHFQKYKGPPGRSQSRSKSSTVFWRPPPEAVVVCESVVDFSAAFPAPPQVAVPESPQTAQKPPRAPVVAVAQRTYGSLPPPLDFSSPGLTPRLQAQSSFPPLHTFAPSPPRHPSNTFMPSPRQLW